MVSNTSPPNVNHTRICVGVFNHQICTILVLFLRSLDTNAKCRSGTKQSEKGH